MMNLDKEKIHVTNYVGIYIHEKDGAFWLVGDHGGGYDSDTMPTMEEVTEYVNDLEEYGIYPRKIQ